MVLTGAAVMVMMSFAAPAMAHTLDPKALYKDYISSSFDPSVFYTPDIGTAGKQIPPEAGGPTPQDTGPVVVGPAPTYTGCWSSDATGNLVPAGGPC